MSLHILGGCARERGNLQKARESLEESAALARELGNTWVLSWDLHNLADLALQQDDSSRAWLLGCEGLALAREIGDDLAALNCLGYLSVAAARLDNPRRAGTLWGAAERLNEELGETMWRWEQAKLERMFPERGPDFELGVEEGRRVSLDEAVALALDSGD